MAISVSFGGATIFRPGSYSRTTIDVGGGFPIGPAGLIVVFGEADAGTPGASEVDIKNNRFTADQMPEIRAKYRSGPIVDAAGFLFSPAADAAIPSGAQTVWFYKTNASVRASLALATAYGTARAREWGIGGNRITVEVVNTAEVAPVIQGTTIENFGVALNGASFVIHENGGAAKTITLSTTPDDHDTQAHLISEMTDLFTAASLTSVVAAGTAPDSIKITHAADATAHVKGFGKTIELVGENLSLFGLTAGLTSSSVEAASTIRLVQARDSITEEETVGGNAVITIGHSGAGGVTSASVSITATKLTLTTSAGTVDFVKANYPTVKELADDIDLLAGWSASVVSSQYNQLTPDVLDNVTTVGALSTGSLKPAKIKKDSAEVAAMFDASTLVEIVSQAVVGLPDAVVKTPLAGGLKGGTTSAEIIAALDKFTKFHVNFVLPLFSRDAADDISDGLTESTSTYTIDAIHQAVKTHISLMKSVKKKSERQGFLSYKKSFDLCKDKAGIMADGRLQLVIQDIRQVDSAGNIKWFQPWALAALLAGARSGAAIGEPMTFKFMNLSGIRHTAQPMATAEADIVIDFDPDTMTDEAIQAGITFLEARQTGGFRVVVDNTTYGRDGNFVWNRGNVIYAADIVAFNFRQQLEDIYVGKKNTIQPAEVASTASSILDQFKAQGITVGTADAPSGYKNLTVRIEGNTIYISVIIKIVEGVDFVFSELTIQRATQG